MTDCNSPCAGNPFQQNCGGPWRVMVYNYACGPALDELQPWQDATLPVDRRIEDLLQRFSLKDSIAQLTQNGADVYNLKLQLPRYIVSQGLFRIEFPD